MKLRAALCATLILLCVSRSHLPPAYASGSADEAWQGTISVDFKSHVETDTTDELLARYHVLKRSVARHATATSAVYSSFRLSAETETEWTGAATVDLHTSATDYTLDSRTDPAPAYEEKGYDAATSGATTAQGSVRFFRNTDEKDPRKARCHVEVDAQDDWRDRPELKVSRTGRNWRFFRPPEPSASWDYAINDKVALAPTFVGFDFACDPDGTAYSGQQLMKMNPDGTTTQLVTWSIHRGALPETEVELIPPAEYGQWLPQAGEDEKTLGDLIDVEIVAHTKGDPASPPPRRVLKYTITLQDTAKEKGVDLNWPSQYANGGPTEDYDFQIDETNPWIKITDDKGQSAETKEEGLTDFRVTLNSYDWGGWTHLKVVAELSDHSTVVAHVRGHPDQEALAVPKDDNSHHIADAWEGWYELPSNDGAADDDDVPVGDGTKGDNVALYEEYRGFHIGKDNHHERLSPVFKDLFIVDYDQLGAGIYQKSTGVHVHLLTPQQTAISDQNAAAHQAANYVTVNGHYGRAYAIALRNTHIGTWGVGSTEPGVGVPAAIQVVQIDAAVIAFGYKDDAPAELQVTIAHELGHATNVYHHGETEYNVGDVVCKNTVTNPDGSVTLTGDVTNHMCSGKQPVHGTVLNNGVPRLTGAADNCWVVAGKGGEFSGNDQCPMRYDMANYYEDPNGLCRALKGGHGVLLSDYGQDHPGMGVFCSAKNGTGVNDPANPHNKAGDATLGRCAAQIRLK